MLHSTMRARLLKRLTDSTAAFAKLGDTVQTKHGPLTHIDRGGSVLAVAHLDFVRWDTPSFSRRGNTVYCGQLDDRLGAWIALDLLPSLGLTIDVLLTDSEEIGQSTAQYFDSPKDYNWIVQFDRAGTDVVMYEYDCESNRQLVESYGYQTGIGSFSDICWLSHLGISGFNIGTGYYRQHTKHCHALLRETVENARRFVPMFNDWQSTRIDAPPVERYSDGGSLAWDWEGSAAGYRLADDGTFCAECGTENEDDYRCRSCGTEFVFCSQCGETISQLDWECRYCGVERSDMTMTEFVNRLARDTVQYWEDDDKIPV